jgi:hypothetical protein
MKGDSVIEKLGSFRGGKSLGIWLTESITTESTCDLMSDTSDAMPAESSEHTLSVCELKLDTEAFDPTTPQLKKTLLELLDMEGQSTIERLHGWYGANNLGIWFVKDSCLEQDLIIKQVSLRYGEGDKLLAVASNYPSIVQDRSLAFPTKIVHCSVDGEVVHELIVTPKVQAEEFTDFIGEKWYSTQPNAKHEIFRAMEQLGRQLKEFHIRYSGAQHGDFQPSNVFYDRSANVFTFIDLADVATPINSDKDVQTFQKSLSAFAAATYGPQFARQSQASFARGYASL